MFTSLTILASVIMFKDWDGQNATQIVTEMCGFITILSGTFLLHKTKDMVDSAGMPFSPVPNLIYYCLLRSMCFTYQIVSCTEGYELLSAIT
jgi:hypothetical protein